MLTHLSRSSSRVTSIPRATPLAAAPRTRRTTRWAASAGLVLAILLAAVGAVIRFWPQAPAEVLPSFVPPQWAEFRTSAGHRVHVGKAKLACTKCHDLGRGQFRRQPEVGEQGLEGEHVHGRLCRRLGDLHGIRAAVDHREGLDLREIPLPWRRRR